MNDFAEQILAEAVFSRNVTFDSPQEGEITHPLSLKHSGLVAAAARIRNAKIFTRLRIHINFRRRADLSTITLTTGEILHLATLPAKNLP